MSYQVNEQEIRWSGFLVDQDVAIPQPFFEKAVAAIAQDHREMLAEAWDANRTIVTSDRPGFRAPHPEFSESTKQTALQGSLGIGCRSGRSS